ncbi:MAG TPA: restriction endonuclease subunit S [Burkholderiales bacterium]|nr:restriction endonuclease subunit S [Burkholderiales bacterium]
MNARNSWPMVPIQDFADVVTGGTPSTLVREYWIGGSIPWLNSGELNKGVVVSADKFITKAGLESSSARMMPADTVLVALTGATTGISAILKISACANQSVTGILPSSAHVPSYLLHYLRSIRSRIVTDSWGGAQKHINQAYVKHLQVPLPPISEQRRIAAVLDKADALRTKRRAALNQLDTFGQSVFLDMFGDPIQNPHRFPVKKLVELVDPKRPISYGILKPGPNQSEGVKYVRVVDMKDGGIALSGIKRTTEEISNAYRRSLLKQGDLLLSIRGHVGRLAVIPAELTGANITQDTARLALKGTDAMFVRECLRTPGFQRWMSRHTKGVAVQGINLSDVKLMPIIQPRVDQQSKLRRIIERLESTRLAHSLSVAACDALFCSLRDRAFSGQL